jgi:hypothetical protein
MMAAEESISLVEAAMRTGRMHASHAARRGSVARVLLVALLSALAVGPGTGCGAGDTDAGGAGDRGANAAADVTEEGLVSYVAGLTVAVEDGLVGEAARLRAAELGAPRYERAQVEAFAARLREDPERWVRIAARIDERVKALRAAEETPASEAASRPSPEAAP